MLAALETQGGPPAERNAAPLAARYGGLDGIALLRVMATREFAGRIAVVSSFGTESAVLLALVAEVDPRVPVLFLETGKHFDETRRYRDDLIDVLGLEDVRLVMPAARRTVASDPDGTLWRRDPDACCHLRKVTPLKRALAPWDAWVTGRKRFQGGERRDLPAIEAADGKVKINPLATWTKDRIEAEFETRRLPRHPLEAEGFRSVGCAPCSHPVTGTGCPRSGRWAGFEKTECGIHRTM